MGLGIEVEIVVSGLAVHSVSQGAIRSSVNVSVMMELGLEAEIGVWACGTLFVPESHQVFCKYPSPGRVGGLHFRFPR
jgi:hypothetical protein